MWRTLRSPLVIAQTHGLTLAGESDIGYARDDHLPSGQWYIYESPNRKPELLNGVMPAYVPEYEQ
jgi:hypothetical protein